MFISGFNGIMVKYEETCDLDCGPMVYFEYMAYLRLMDSTLHYTPSLNEVFVCQNEDSLYLYNIYCPSFHPLVGHFIFRYDYINGETGVAYYQSAWDRRMDRKITFSLLMRMEIPYLMLLLDSEIIY